MGRSGTQREMSWLIKSLHIYHEHDEFFFTVLDYDCGSYSHNKECNWRCSLCKELIPDTIKFQCVILGIIGISWVTSNKYIKNSYKVHIMQNNNLIQIGRFTKNKDKNYYISNKLSQQKQQILTKNNLFRFIFL